MSDRRVYHPDDAAQFYARSAGKPYRPSNGTEGEIFEATWCDHCQRDAAFRRFFDSNGAIGGDQPDYPRDAILVLDGYDRAALQAASGAVGSWLAASPLAGADTAWTSYRLGYVVGAADLRDVVVAPQQAMPASSN